MEKLVFVLGVTVLTVALFRKFKLPSIIAYLSIGCLLGPFGLDVLNNTEQIKLLAEIGVVFLLFTIGLELPLSKFIEMRYNLLFLGGSQVILCTFFMSLLMYLLNYNIVVSLVAGSSFSLSSTAIIMKQLSEQNELFTKSGQLAFAMLIFQDIAVVPLLVMLPVFADLNIILQSGVSTQLNNNLDILWSILSVLFKGVIVFTIILAMSKSILRNFFHKIAVTRSLELFMLSVLFVALLSAYVTHSFGLSMSFGAFIAGVGLGESEYRHQIDSEIRPFRDILLGIFFISIGMLLDFDIVLTNFYKVIFCVTALVLIKFTIIFVLCYLLGKKISYKTSIKTGLIMAHSGEFGLAILTLAASYKIMSEDMTQIILSSMILSLFIAVLLTKYSDRLSDLICLNINHNKKSHTNNHVIDFNRQYPDLKDHVIICGFGRVGKIVADCLKSEQQEYIGIDTDARIVKNNFADHYNVFFGDTSKRDILPLVGLGRAKLLIICIDDEKSIKKIIMNVRNLNSEIPVLVRAKDLKNYQDLITLGATEVISETLEASMMLVLHMLLMLGMKPTDAMSCITKKREDRYELLK